jgi:hypothetical protein
VGTLEEGAVIGTYRVEGVLGRGGMGVVYRARDRRLDRLVALKLLSGETAQDPRFRERFLRESRAAAGIDHPNVLPVYEAAEVGGQLYIAMRLVEGEDLAELLKREGALPPARALRLVAQVADALDAVHAHGLVHRDVKPSNVLLHRAAVREHAYLADFGITRLATQNTPLTATGAFVGTIDYCAPEVIRGDRLDARSDVYSLGCVLFECLTGEKPFVRDSEVNLIYAHLEAPVPAPRDRRPDLPVAVDGVVVRAMAKDPDARFASAGELAAAAAAALGGPPAPTRATPTKPAARAPRRRIVVGGGLLGAAAVVAAVVAFGGDGDDGGGAPQTTAEDSAAQRRVPADEGRSVVGSALTQTPGDSGYCSGAVEGSSACTVVQIRLGADDQAVRADGVITRWSVRGGKGELALRVIDGPRGRRRVVARGPTVQATGEGVQSFAVSIPVAAGQRIGVEQGRTGFVPFRYRDETTTAEFYNPPLPTAATALTSGGSGPISGYEYLYNATVEPDDDGDDRGDLTQDPDHGGVGADCPARGVLARGAGSSVVRVGDEIFGCRGGVRTLVGEVGGGVRLRLFTFAGDQLALVRVEDGESSILGFDLGDRRPTFSTPKTFYDERPADWTVRALVVASNGNAAWMSMPAGAPDRTAVFTRRGRRVRNIDSGSLDPGSLRVADGGASVKYTDGEGRPRDSSF